MGAERKRRLATHPQVAADRRGWRNRIADAHDPRVRCTRQRLVGEQPAGLVDCEPAALREIGNVESACPDRAFAVGRGDTRTEPQFDTESFQPLHHFRASTGRQAGPDRSRRESHPKLGKRLGDLSARLDSGESAADHRDRRTGRQCDEASPQPLRRLQIGDSVRILRPRAAVTADGVDEVVVTEPRTGTQQNVVLTDQIHGVDTDFYSSVHKMLERDRRGCGTGSELV